LQACDAVRRLVVEGKMEGLGERHEQRVVVYASMIGDVRALRAAGTYVSSLDECDGT